MKFFHEKLSQWPGMCTYIILSYKHKNNYESFSDLNKFISVKCNLVIYSNRISLKPQTILFQKLEICGSQRDEQSAILFAIFDICPDATTHYLLVKVDAPAGFHVFVCIHEVRTAGDLILIQTFPVHWRRVSSINGLFHYWIISRLEILNAIESASNYNLRSTGEIISFDIGMINDTIASINNVRH